jgi:hypothetical protein
MEIIGGQIRGRVTGDRSAAATRVTGIQIGLTSTDIRGRAADPITIDTSVSLLEARPRLSFGHATVPVTDS